MLSKNLKVLGIIIGAAITEDKVNNTITSIGTGINKILKTIGTVISGAGSGILFVYLAILIFKTMSDAKGGNPEAWKDSAGRIGIVAVLAVVLAIVTTALL